MWTNSDIWRFSSDFRSFWEHPQSGVQMVMWRRALWRGDELDRSGSNLENYGETSSSEANHFFLTKINEIRKKISKIPNWNSCWHYKHHYRTECLQCELERFNLFPRFLWKYSLRAFLLNCLKEYSFMQLFQFLMTVSFTIDNSIHKWVLCIAWSRFPHLDIIS